MKLIASFDAAVENLGVCYVQYDEDWRSKISTHVDNLHALYETIDSLSMDEFLNAAKPIIHNINSFIDNIIHIKFFNVFDLIPGTTARSVPMLERTRRLKHLLKQIDHTLPNPDIVLIEYQMKQNDISRTISNQIAMHYIDSGNQIIEYTSGTSVKRQPLNRDQPLNTNITYAVKLNPLIALDLDLKSIVKLKPSPIVELVGPTLKNTVSLMPNGHYSNFIMKYSNYTANKKHTSANFGRYAKVFNIDLSSINNKIDDIADGFMMIFAWLKKKNEI